MSGGRLAHGTVMMMDGCFLAVALGIPAYGIVAAARRHGNRFGGKDNAHSSGGR
jgi:uncharacterized membrane protein